MSELTYERMIERYTRARHMAERISRKRRERFALVCRETGIALATIDIVGLTAITDLKQGKP